jgi:hypothetical protein
MKKTVKLAGHVVISNIAIGSLPTLQISSVADPDPGSGDPGSGIRNRFFLDPGSRIPDPKPKFLRTY